LHAECTDEIKNGRSEFQKIGALHLNFYAVRDVIAVVQQLLVDEHALRAVEISAESEHFRNAAEHRVVQIPASADGPSFWEDTGVFSLSYQGIDAAGDIS